MILVVDDDLSLGKVLVAILRQSGLRAEHVSSGKAALEALERRPVQVILSDLRMPEMDGMALLDRTQELYPDIPLVMLTAHGSVAIAVDAMKRGAADFLLKPFDREEVIFTVRKAIALTDESAPPQAPSTGGAMIGGAAIAQLDELIRKVAPSITSVLIRGETGTGKELVAQAIHQTSNRADKPFVVINCAALPENLLESELFGHEKGAFTGATHQKPGRVELADGGTLFLDEVGELPPAVQPKLLRLLQEKEYTRVGGASALSADVRFIAATHRDLEKMVDDGSFREDLFYRLNVVPIVVPPLRQRREDISMLVEAFSTGSKLSGPTVTFEDAAIAELEQRPWPGNVRELLHAVERLTVFADGTKVTAAVVEEHLPRKSASGDVALDSQNLNLAEHRVSTERRVVEEALRRAKGNRSLAARLLSVSRRTLYNKLEELGIASE